MEDTPVLLQKEKTLWDMVADGTVREEDVDAEGKCSTRKKKQIVEQEILDMISNMPKHVANDVLVDEIRKKLNDIKKDVLLVENMLMKMT